MRKLDRFDRVFCSILSICGVVGWVALTVEYWPISGWGDRVFVICAGVAIPYLPWAMAKSERDRVERLRRG